MNISYDEPMFGPVVEALLKIGFVLLIGALYVAAATFLARRASNWAAWILWAVVVTHVWMFTVAMNHGLLSGHSVLSLRYVGVVIILPLLFVAPPWSLASLAVYRIAARAKEPMRIFLGGWLWFALGSALSVAIAHAGTWALTLL